MEKKILSKRDVGDGIQTTIQLLNSDKSNITTDEISEIVNRFSTCSYYLAVLISFIIGIVVHRLFCVRTTIDKLLFP